jgi:methyl-accepting chemotaxis protein
MKHQRYVLAVILSSVFVVVSLICYLSNGLFIESTRKNQINQLKLTEKIIEFNFQTASNKSLARSEIIANLPTVKELFANGKREVLYEYLRNVFEVQGDKFGVDQAHFHTYPATSFLRFHDPDQFGDDLSKVRPEVVAVNADKVPRKGVSVTRLGPGIFGVIPVSDKLGKHIGTFEMGGDIGAVLEGVKTSYGLDSVVFMNEELLKSVAPKLGGDLYSDKNRIGKYVKYKSTNWELIKELVTDEKLSKVKDQSISDVKHMQGVTYGVAMIPLISINGDNIGIIVAAQDFTESELLIGKFAVWSSIFAFIGVILIFSIVVILIKGTISKPLAFLNLQYQSLATDVPLEPKPELMGYYGEIYILAKNYDTLYSQHKKNKKL